MTWVGVATNIKYFVPSNFYKTFMAPGHLRPTLGLWASCPDNEGKEAVSTGSWNDGHQGRGTEAHSPPAQDWDPTSLPCSFPPRPSHHSVLQGAIFSTDWGRGSQHRNQNPGVWDAHHHPCLLVGLFFFFGCAEWHMGSWFLDQGLSPRSLQWKCRVLTTGLSGKSLPLVFKCSPRKHKSHWRQDLSHCLPTAPRTPGIP